MTKEIKTPSLVQGYKEINQRIDELVKERMELRDKIRKATQKNESTLSTWLRGQKKPNKHNRAVIAKALNQTEKELFPYLYSTDE